jgi:pimeloyl-ACP methyl ester carboxylesterase
MRCSTRASAIERGNVAEPKTYVLVHGAFHGGWCWRDVAARLRALGHAVYTPTQTGLGERAHLIHSDPSLETFIEDIANVFRYEDIGDAILVGHSFAGSVISAVADRMPERLRHLVYLDAGLLESGQCPADMPPADVLAAYKRRAVTLSSGVVVLPPSSPQSFGITEPAQAAWAAEKLMPHPFRTYFDQLELRHPLGNGVKATYIACSVPLFPNTARARALAKSQPGWGYLEIPTGHNAMMTMPDELSDMLTVID